MLCQAVDVQLGRDSTGESHAGFLLVVMTTASEGVAIPVEGVILDPILSVRASLGENPIHLLDERRWCLWRCYLVEGIVGGDTSWPGGRRPATGVAGRLGASGELEGVAELMRRRPTSCWRPGVASCFVGLTTCSGQRWLALLFSCQCSAGQRRRAALVAMTRWDDMACSGLWRAVQLRCGYSGAVHRQKTVQGTTYLVSMTTEAAHASGATR